MKLILLHASIIALALAFIGTSRAQTSMQIVADNDFAMFVGDDSGATRLIYQNDVPWPSQLSNLSNFTFNLQTGETTFYLLAMGGGGVENISGLVNGVDLPTINVAQSSNLASFLAGYFTDGEALGASDGTYSASLEDVQAAFPTLTWGLPTPTTDDDYVAGQSPTGHGFHFDDSNAVLYRFAASDVNVATVVPEPSTCWLLMLGGVAVIAARRAGFLRFGTEPTIS